MKFTKLTFLASALAALAAMVFPAGAQTAGTTSTNDAEPAYDLEQLSYAIGAKFGADASNTIKRIEIDVDWAAVARGFSDRLVVGAKLTDEQVRAMINQFQLGLQERLSKKHRKEGDAFREQFKAQENITTTDSGLIIKTDTFASGPKPTSNDVVTVNYRVTLIDGTEVDSSYKRGQPAEFPVKAQIPGWAEALQLMPVGSHCTVVIPPELAYGDNGIGQSVGPAQTLVYYVELLSCKPGPPPSPPRPPDDLLKSGIVVVPSQADLEKGAQPKVLNTVDSVAEEYNRQKQQLEQQKK